MAKPIIPPYYFSTFLPILKFSTDIPIRLTLLDRAALVELLLAACDCELDLDSVAFIIHRNRDDCQTPGSFDFHELRDLAHIEQELAVAARIIVLRGVVFLIGRYEAVLERDRSAASVGVAFDQNVRSLEVAMLCLEAFYLVAQKLHASFVTLEDFVVECCF